MYPALGFQVAIGVIARYFNCDGLYPRLFPVQVVQNAHAVAVPLAVARVHAIEHLDPVLRLRAARAGMQGEYGVAGIVRALEQKRKPKPFDPRFDRAQLLVDFGQERIVPFLGGELNQRLKIVHRARKRREGVDPRAQRFDLLVELVRLLKIGPYVWIGNLFFERLKLRLQLRQVHRLPRLRNGPAQFVYPKLIIVQIQENTSSIKLPLILYQTSPFANSQNRALHHLHFLRVVSTGRNFQHKRRMNKTYNLFRD